LAEGGIVDIEFRKGRFAALEREILYFIISFGLVGVGFVGLLLCPCKGGARDEEDQKVFHDAEFVLW
jgi:hypothetical protein